MPWHKLTKDQALWRRRFLVPQVYWTQVAQATPDQGLVGTDLAGTNQLYSWSVSTGELGQLTDGREGVPFGMLSPDGRYAYYLQDLKGSEFGGWVRVRLTGGEPEDIARDIAPYSSWNLTLSGSGNLAGLILADAEGFHVYCISVDTNGDLGAPKMLYETAGLAEGPFLSHEGDLAVLATSERSGGLRFGLLALETTRGEAIGELWDGPGSNINPRLFSPIAGDSRLLATTTRSGYRRPLIWNPRTGERTDLELGEVQGEVVPWDWSRDGKHVLLCSAFGAVQRMYVYEFGSGALHALGHPSGTYWYAYFGLDGDIYAEWEDATHPRQLIALDARIGRLKRTVLSVSDQLPGRAWRSVMFASSDGQAVQGWLGVPEGDGPFPAIIEVHGGPASWVSQEYSPESQAWMDHGYAYFTINYRGSSSFGREFEEVVHGDPGHWEIEDIVAAREWLVRNGVAAADRILLKGFSYGGYLVLQALGARPELWAGGSRSRVSRTGGSTTKTWPTT